MSKSRFLRVLGATYLSMYALIGQASSQPVTTSDQVSLAFTNISAVSSRANLAQCQALFQPATFSKQRLKELAAHPFNLSPLNQIMSLKRTSPSSFVHQTSPNDEKLSKELAWVGTNKISLDKGKSFFNTSFRAIENPTTKIGKIIIGDYADDYCTATFTIT